MTALGGFVAQLVGGEQDGEELAVQLPEPETLRFVRSPQLSVLDAEPVAGAVLELDEIRYRRAGLNDYGVRRYVLVGP